MQVQGGYLSPLITCDGLMAFIPNMVMKSSYSLLSDLFPVSLSLNIKSI